MSPWFIVLLIVVLTAMLLLYFWFRSRRDRGNSWVLRPPGPSGPNRDGLAGSGVPRRPSPSLGGAQVELKEKPKEKTSVGKS